MNSTKIVVVASTVIAASLPTIAAIRAIKDKKAAMKLEGRRNPIKTVAYIANALSA